ncbi:MAG: HAD family hydrolase [Breznakia sp.]
MPCSVDMKNLELVIFDMDGLMLDTGKFAYLSYVESAKKYNFEMVQDIYYHLTGRRDSEIIEGMRQLYGDEKDVVQWRKTMVKKRIEMIEKATSIGKKPGLEILLQFLKERSIKIALASSNTSENIKRYLRMENLENTFDYILSGEMVSKGKPDPEIFLKACEIAKVDVGRALVLEDSIVGVKSAKSANIAVFLIRDHLKGLPTYHGKYKIQKKIKLEYEQPSKEFQNLWEVKEYLR